MIVFKAWEKPVCLVLASKDDQYFLDHHPPLKFDPKPHKDQVLIFLKAQNQDAFFSILLLFGQEGN